MTALSPCVLAWLNTVAPSTPTARAPSRTGAARVSVPLRRDLDGHDPPVADRDDVGEGAADVDADHQTASIRQRDRAEQRAGLTLDRAQAAWHLVTSHQPPSERTGYAALPRRTRGTRPRRPPWGRPRASPTGAGRPASVAPPSTFRPVGMFYRESSERVTVCHSRDAGALVGVPAMVDACAGVAVITLSGWGIDSHTAPARTQAPRCHCRGRAPAQCRHQRSQWPAARDPALHRRSRRGAGPTASASSW